MHRFECMKSNQQSCRRGFTLIELLVTISIIAILAALLMGGIQAARLAVNNAKATQEINSLTSALAQFHNEFGMYPPSSITLCEKGTDWNLPANIRSKSLIRKLWPNYDFATRSIDGDTVADEQIQLDGRECLAFFLGGMITGRPSNSIVPKGAAIGFSKNPSNPFSTTGSNRVGPFHEFQNARYIDTDGDRMYEYLDTYAGQQTPILYLSSYDGRGYRTSEVSPASPTAPQPFLVNGAYKQGSAAGTAWKSKTYQLISPGVDGEYGTGGWYDEATLGGIDPLDHDNITNFASGKLK